MSYDRDAAIREQLSNESIYPAGGRSRRQNVTRFTDWELSEIEPFSSEDLEYIEYLNTTDNASHHRLPHRRARYEVRFSEHWSEDHRATPSSPTQRTLTLSEISASGSSTEAIRAALRSAHERGDTMVPVWLLKALGEDLRDNTTRELLIDFSELVAWAFDMRPEVMAALLKQAVVLRNERPAEYDRSLSVALRTIAGMAPLDRGGEFVAFLRASDPPRTKHAALAAIRILYSAEPPTGEQSILWGRLAELLEKYLDPELTSSIEVTALALNTFIAAAASGLPQLAEFTSFATVCLPPLMKWQLAEDLRDLFQDWQARDSARTNPRAAALLREAIDALST